MCGTYSFLYKGDIRDISLAVCFFGAHFSCFIIALCFVCFPLFVQVTTKSKSVDAAKGVEKRNTLHYLRKESASSRER